MADYTETYSKVTGNTINVAEFETEFDAIATSSATKANKTGAPATTNNLAMLDATGDLADSLVETDGAGNITANLTGNVTGSATELSGSNLTGDVSNVANAMSVDSVQANAIVTASITDANVTTAKLESGERMTTANVDGAIAGSTLDDVGTYSYLAGASTNTTFTAGTNYAGSGLRYSGLVTNAGSYASATLGGTPTGTWKAMGTCTGAASSYSSTLFLKVS